MFDRQRHLAFSLSILLALFVFRVLAQLSQYFIPTQWLPQFDEWQSGALPYPLLFVSQLSIIAVCVRVIVPFFRGSAVKKPVMGAWLLVLGGVYFAVMVFRLSAAFSFARTHPWLGAYIPAIFHLVLASFVLLLGFYHSEYGKKLLVWASYPLIVGAALVAFSLCVDNDVSPAIAAYAPVLAAAALITLLQMYMPYRSEWQPTRGESLTDASFMLFVQVLLPRLLGLLTVLMLGELAQSHQTGLENLWPHHWPVLAQLVLMLLGAEFFRYWLHRLAHTWRPLWQFHAVHHSPHKLNWLNVGRFHPVEKILQYLFDALPFLLFGVSPTVLAAYFVFYAVNGFFQHSNIELRLGWLNYLISGPELHRWHHSMLTHESNNNYGNNLIVWDTVFATRFLPENRKVDTLGLVNRSYPDGLFAQMKTPFIAGLDKRR